VNNERAVFAYWAAAEKLRAGETDVPERLAEPMARWMLACAETARSKWCPPVDAYGTSWETASLILDSDGCVCCSRVPEEDCPVHRETRV
jgi:hypothetical protein